jgi:hypothetical protein
MLFREIIAAYSENNTELVHTVWANHRTADGVSWVVAPRSLLLIVLMMEAARSSETLVNFYQTTRRYNPKDSHLRTRRRENLKSYQLK